MNIDYDGTTCIILKGGLEIMLGKSSLEEIYLVIDRLVLISIL